MARRTAESGDVPVGAIVVDSLGVVVGRGRNAREAATSGFDPTAHAEVVALRAAARSLGRWRLDGCTLAVTLEPCPMCAGALMLARVSRVVFGAWDPKLGACGSVWDIPRDRRATHRAEVVGGIREAECAALLLDFFAGQRGRGDAPGAAGPAADDDANQGTIRDADGEIPS
ncbi:tRNA-specific adenosine deaminase [Nostocoides japonicum T1-X7]|uniref:tRNA-specific adenosine deaminase n=1 Tax=Nostocoides japonicum T1-X7 TaxID=1194083 RepID=A0A077M1X6_9MICO|nr:tRNA-specific adenosine deaminase [Tetrasphaera japonica T1-X7]